MKTCCTSSMLILFGFLLSTTASTPAFATSYTITDLGTFGGTGTYASSINNKGQIVGGFNIVTSATATSNGGSTSHSFLYSNGIMTDLGSLGSGNSFPIGINNNGQVIGYSYGGGASGRAFLYSNGVMSDLGTLGGATSWASGINDSGKIVGNSTTAGGYVHAFLYDNGAMTDLGTLGGPGSSASGINNNGQVVGVSNTEAVDFASTGRYATNYIFSYTDGTMTNLGPMGGTASNAIDVNDNGQILGFSYDRKVTRAFIYDNGVMTDLGTLGGSASNANSFNNHGQVVGDSFVAGNSTTLPFLYSNGTMQDVNTLLPEGSGWTITGAMGINDLGQIVGGGTINGQSHAYLMTPTSVPLPAGFWLLGSGLVGLLGVASRKTPT